MGEFLAFLTAVIWGFSVIFFKKSGEKTPPIILNLFKNVTGLFLFILTSLILKQAIFLEASLEDYGLLLLSGILGIAIADTMFFECLNRLGAGLTAVVDCCYSPSIIALSFFFLGESMSLLQTFGVAVILFAILITTNKDKNENINKKNLWLGIIFGVLAQFLMATGIVMIKPMLKSFPILWVIQVRLIGGIAFLLLYCILHPHRKSHYHDFFLCFRCKYTLIGSFIGTYLAIITWLAGMKYAQVSIASALNQTSNIFIFIFAAIFLKEALDSKKIISMALGFTGVILIIIK